MILVSWNVNGLCSSEQYFIKFINNAKPDLLMIQELRAYEDQLSIFLKSIPEYNVVFNPADRPGYSGTALYYKKSININTQVQSFDMIDQVPSPSPILHQEGRMIECRVGDIKTHKQDQSASEVDIRGLTPKQVQGTIFKPLNETIILNFYIPNGNSSDRRLRYKMIYYSAINKYVKDLLANNYPIIIAGDLNVAHTEKDLFNPKGSTNISGFLEKERRWFSEILKLGFIDTFRMFEKAGGHYSWWSMRDPKRKENKGWRFDYFLISRNLE